MVTLRLDNGLKAHAPLATCNRGEIEQGREVSCCVTDLDFVSDVLMVSLNPKLVEGVHKMEEESGEEQEEREETRSKGSKKKKRKSIIKERKEKYKRKTEVCSLLPFT